MRGSALVLLMTLTAACDRPAWKLHASDPPLEDAPRAMLAAQARAATDREWTAYELLHPGARAAFRHRAIASDDFDAAVAEGEALFAIDAPWDGDAPRSIVPVHTKGGAPTPDATRCAACHHVGGRGGAGTFADLAYFEAIGDDATSATRRLPRMLAGAALLELAAADHPEMHPYGWAPGRPRRLRDMVAWSVTTHLGEPARDDEIDALTAFIASLPPPVTRAPSRDSLVLRARRGEAAFGEMGCATCHTPRLAIAQTVLALSGGRRIDVSAILGADRSIYPYSDLRAHDLGPELGGTYVTAPLWGIASRGPFLHDGRAQTFGEAIAAHGGEAKAAREAWTKRQADQRDVAVFFLTLTRAPELTWTR